MIHLIPAPKKFFADIVKVFPWDGLDNIVLPVDYTPSLLKAALQFADEFEAATGKRLRFCCGVSFSGLAIELKQNGALAGVDAYAMRGDGAGIVLEGADESGLFYAIQTLRQLLKQPETTYPEFKIEDSADFPVRGFYHDATRGAIPTLETLFQLVDKMAYYKMNQLQLYIEHTFALARHCDIWEGSDPLTAEEILRLQDYCRERHVELVPSISTFGHFYMALRSKRNEELNELDVKASEKPFSFRDRMAHYTLNPSDPRSIALVEEILDEFLPLFQSKYCNICCDETFDLGRGKSHDIAPDAAAIRKVYVGFLKKIIALVSKQGKTAMFWGDIIGDESELIKELPADVIPLEWDYGPESNRRDTVALSKVTKNFYICPGTTVWNCWLGDVVTAQKNILSYAKKGLPLGAKGLLNTNWGDYGNINLPAVSWYGFVYGAAVSWNMAAAENVELFEDALDVLELGADGLAASWRRFMGAAKANWTEISWWVDPSDEISNEGLIHSWHKENDAKPAIGRLETLFADFNRRLKNASPVDPLAKEELRFGAEMTILMHRIFSVIWEPDKATALALADEVRRKEVQMCQLWHRRNKPSEYYRVKEALLRIAQKLDTLG